MNRQIPPRRHTIRRQQINSKTHEPPTKEKDRLRTEFGERLRGLLGLAGLSSRAFAQRHPAYRDSTIRKYTSGKNLPAWDFLRDLLAEVDRSVTDSLGGERAADLFAAYRTVLVRVGADIRGSDQNSLLLRLYDGEQVLAELKRDIELLREGADQIRGQIDAERRTNGDSEKTRGLESRSEELAGRREALVSKRADLVGDLERCRKLLQMMEQAPQPELEPTADDPDVSRSPEPAPASRLWLKAGAVALGVLLLAAAALGGVLYQGSRTSADRSPQATPTATKPSPTSPTPQPSLSPSTPTPTPSSTSPKPDDDEPPIRRKINLPEGYALDFSPVEPEVVTGLDDLTYGTVALAGSQLNNYDKHPLVLLGERETGSLQGCLADTRFSTEGIDFDLLRKGSQICAISDEGHVALVTIRTMPDPDAASAYLGLDVTIWRFAADASTEEQ